MKPTGCTLDGGALLERAADFAALFRRALRRRESTATTATWTFAWSDEVEAAVRDLAASESSCCAFFRFDIARVGDELRWTLSAPPVGAQAVAMLDGLAVEALRRG